MRPACKNTEMALLGMDQKSCLSFECRTKKKFTANSEIETKVEYLIRSSQFPSPRNA